MKKSEQPRPKRWAVCKKGYWKVTATYFSKEQAENSIKGRENIYEVREVIG